MNTRTPRIIRFDYAAESADYPAPCCRASGKVDARISRGHSIWAITGELAEGATLEWADGHGEESVYVLDGAFDVNGMPCGKGECIIVDANVAAMARARAPTRIVHFGPTDPSSPTDGPLGEVAGAGHGVHVVTEEDAEFVSYVDKSGTVFEQRFYADGTSPTNRLALFKVTCNGPAQAPMHSHTQDEIIHVVRGEVHVGKLVIGAGKGVAIKGDQRYAFTTPDAWEFLNYRRDVSYIALPNRPLELETAEVARAMIANGEHHEIE